MYKIVNSKLIANKNLHHIFIVLSVLLIVSCDSNNSSSREDIVVATIGSEQITVADFRRNYEFGMPHLKREPNRKLSYLNYMINEKILSLEGYKRGFETTKRVKKLEKKLLDELLVEELFIKNVNSKIVIPPEEVKEAILKSQVSWKMNFWFEKSEEQAYFIKDEISKNGFENTLKTIFNHNPEVKLKSEDFVTDYITWLEIAPEIMNEIKDLAINEISEPIKLAHGYFVFQIKDIRREPISEYDIQDKYERFRQILYYKKLKEEASNYIVSVMGPKNVVTNGKTLFELTKAYLDWKKNSSERNFQNFILENNSNILSKKLVTFNQEVWKVSDFIDKFDPQKIDTSSSNVKKIGSEISQQIALQVRDYNLIKLALDSDLDKEENVQKQLGIWRDKWVYDETRKYYLKDIILSDDETKNYFEKNITSFQINVNDPPKYEEFKNTAKKFAYIHRAGNLLKKNIDSLKIEYSVSINNAVLDTIQTIDSKKSRWQSLQVFKRSSNRLAFPIVDPAWNIN